ncbi:phosphoserine phosphatase SerB [Alysiella crassa]|uniref:Phosphoserine phosphatase n=1 Tax=Alysiella crassa TaxID=153491 RepID=A0A376BT66_9NEIS|nr:phosphoserine phosphatase SerB [Alysiella crassa]UOP07966.1 phosphoserine phosphatase SerB [Alysiella crassa]SSY80028.1 Phosphoserine phosphatase [Alysiella crassa]
MSHVFIIQNNDLANLNLPHTQAYFRLPEKLADNVLRVPVAEDFRLPEDVAAELTAAQCDFAVLPDWVFGDDVKLIVSDMDSTLITIECIDEIAAQAGLKNQVAEITERAMRGELDFEQSLRNRVALLAGLPESALQQVYDNTLTLSDGAAYLLRECHEKGVAFVLVSGGFTFFTEKLKTRLGFQAAFANELEVENGVLTGRVLGDVIDAQTKARILQQFHAQIGGKAVAIGDGANDIPMLQAADLGVAFHAKAKTRQAADVCINFGGLDALRKWFR